MDKILYLLLMFVITIVLIASLRYTLEGFVVMPQNHIFRALMHPGWFVFLIIILPMHMGEFARSEASPLPWVQFSTLMFRHGLADAFIGTAMVLITDLWLFWIPANLLVMYHPDMDRHKHIMARAINFLTGLLLATPANPIYKIIEYSH